MLKAISFFPIPIFFCLTPFLAGAQNDILSLEKRGKEVHSYRTGDPLSMETVYHQSFNGTITAMRHDSIFIDGKPWHYKEIAAIHRIRSGSDFLLFGTALMVAGGGIFVLGAVNGLYRGDPSRNWFTAAGLITGVVATIGGYLLRNAFYIKYRMGRK
jgi:hypothetical protein